MDGVGAVNSGGADEISLLAFALTATIIAHAGP
jgi:hypothetical protein